MGKRKAIMRYVRTRRSQRLRNLSDLSQSENHTDVPVVELATLPPLQPPKLETQEQGNQKDTPLELKAPPQQSQLQTEQPVGPAPPPSARQLRPAAETQIPVLPAPPPPRLQLQPEVETQLQVPPGFSLKNTEEPVEIKPQMDPLLRLSNPTRRHHDPLNHIAAEPPSALVAQVKCHLVNQLTATTADFNSMIELANKAFVTLDWLGDDYSTFHYAVKELIRRHINADQEKRKGGDTKRDGLLLNLKCQLEQLAHKSNAAEQTLMGAEENLSVAEQRQVPIKVRVEEMRQKLSELEKVLTDGDVEIEALRAERERCKEAALKVEADARSSGKLLQAAEVMGREMKQRIQLAMEGIEMAKKRLLALV